ERAARHGVAPVPRGAVVCHFRRASLYRSLPCCMRYSTSFVASYPTQVCEVITKSLGSAMGSNHVAPPSVLSLMPLSDRANRCLESLAFWAWAQTCFQVSLTGLKLPAPAGEQ